MRKFVETDCIHKTFNDLVRQARKSILIISPYVTMSAVDNLIGLLKGKTISCTLVTRPPGRDYITGASDPRALGMLNQHGVIIKCLDSLHAKIYVADENHALLGSANFTERGLGLANPDWANLELMLSITLTRAEFEWIFTNFVENTDTLEVAANWVKRVESAVVDIKDSLRKHISENESKLRCLFNEPLVSPYTEILTKIQSTRQITTFEQIKGGYGYNAFLIDKRYHIKMFRSKIREGNYFSYTVSPGTVRDIANKKYSSVVLVMADKSYAWIPYAFIITRILRRNRRKTSVHSWQFQLVFDGTNYILQTVINHSRHRYVITPFVERVRYRVTSTMRKMTPRLSRKPSRVRL